MPRKLRWFALAALIFALLTTVAVFNIHRLTVRATELFGTGTMFTITERDPEDGDLLLGVVFADSRLFTLHGRIYGRDVQCVLTKVLGETIKDYGGPVSCLMAQAASDKFSGWILFRGHHRQFCGAANLINLPTKCRWGQE